MTTQEKVIQLLESIMRGRKGYCGDHYVFVPQLNADYINQLYAELISEQANAADRKQRRRLI